MTQVIRIKCFVIAAVIIVGVNDIVDDKNNICFVAQVVGCE